MRHVSRAFVSDSGRVPSKISIPQIQHLLVHSLQKCFFYSLIWHFVSNTIALCLKMQQLLHWWGLWICWHLSLDLLKVFDLAKARLGISYCLCFSGENYSQYTCKILYVVRHFQILGYNNLLCIKCFSVLVGGTHNVMNKTVLDFGTSCLKGSSYLQWWQNMGGFAMDSSWGKCFCFFLCKAI